MPTTTTHPSPPGAADAAPDGRGIHLLPADITPEEAGLAEQTVNTYVCPNSELVHAHNDCGRGCTPQCAHSRTHLTAQTHSFGDVEGSLCQCAWNPSNGIVRQLGDQFTAATNIGGAIQDLNKVLSDITDSLQRQAHNETEAGLLQALTELHWSEEACRNADNHGRFSSRITTAFTNARHQIVQQRTQLQADLGGDDPLLRRLLARKAANISLHAEETIDDRNLMAADLYTFRQLTNNSDLEPVDIIVQARGAWIGQVTTAEHTRKPGLEVPAVIDVLRTKCGPQPNLAAAARQYTDRWNQTVDMLRLRHAGRPRLAALDSGIRRYALHDGRNNGRQAIRGFIAQQMPLAQAGVTWHITTIDEAALVGLDAAVSETVDCGPADQLQNEAAAADVALDDVLQMLTQQHARQAGATRPDPYDLMRDTPAAIAALSS